ncbi:hypothetical protein [Candidatus Nitrosotenuis cloacae]|uniref:Uncharacterized protein n=1 Tax=Candidatus Nitrosotenuis cloacae TaxID=1603555 RepID=A0A3G1B5B7_9ARCH|nr:hypothetical protein [Candidatus Nitrosotenuis cloacae]AJZ76199.1 hypothetical protein SU86_007290 [Candidatus Nitrosotenuis cloacae]
MEELGERVSEYISDRKISFDGECYHSRIPLEIMKIVIQYGVNLNSVQWEGVWKDGNKLHVVLSFKMAEAAKQSKSETIPEENNPEKDYVVLKG